MKICDKLKCLSRHRSKSIRVTSLFFCQNDVLTGESFWQKDSLVTPILFDLCLFKHFSLSQIFVISLYYTKVYFNEFVLKKVAIGKKFPLLFHKIFPVLKIILDSLKHLI